MKQKTVKLKSKRRVFIPLGIIVVIIAIYLLTAISYPYGIMTIVKTMGWHTYSYGQAFAIRLPANASVQSNNDITTVSVDGAIITIAGSNAVGDIAGQGYDAGFHTQQVTFSVNSSEVRTTEGISSNGSSRVNFTADDYHFGISYPNQNQSLHAEVNKILSTFKPYK